MKAGRRLQQRNGRRRLPRIGRGILAATGGLVLIKLAVQIYLQLRPHNTPPEVGFVLHSAIRLRYRSVERTLAPAQLRNGLRVLEVGGGTGAFSIPLADAVAPDGSVASIELQRGMQRQQQRRVCASGATNLWLYQADALALPFRDARFDRAVLIACLPMLHDKQRALRELRRVLKNGGLLMVSEELVEPEYVPPAITRAWCTKAGFELLSTHRAGLFYTVVFRNPSRPLAQIHGPRLVHKEDAAHFTMEIVNHELEGV